MAEFEEINENGENGEGVQGGVSEENSNPSKNTEKVFISIDNTIDDIVKYQDEGKEIFFRDGEDDFLALTQEELSLLNNINHTKYTIACGVRYQTLNLSDVNDNRKVFKPRESFASATNRLKIEGGRPDMHYAWKRPDELQQAAYEGGRPCRDPNVKTFGGVDEYGRSVKGSEVKTVSANGIDELVLVEVPKAKADARRKHIEDKSLRQNNAVEATAISEVKSAGGKAYKIDE